MNKFIEWLNIDRKYEIFKKEINNLIIESFDSHSLIKKTAYSDGFKYYYFNINEKQFRVILEVVEDETGINFEQYLNGVYTTSGISNNLDAKEIMILFGTIIYIIEKYAITHHYSIFTDNSKKFRTYLKILSTRGLKNIRYNFLMNGNVAHIQFTLDEKDNLLDRKIKYFKYKFK